jgi:hypothetical protein
MLTLNDAILQATGGPTLNDGLRAFFAATADESLNDAELRWLKSQAGVTAKTISDAWMQFLGGLGFTGTLQDRQLAYWASQGVVFATFDPANKATIMVLSETNHRMVSNSAAARGMGFTTLGVTSGKWYWELLSLTAATAQGFGIGQAASNINEYLGSGPNDWGYFPSGAYWNNAVNQGTGTAYLVNQIVGFALDMAGNLTAYVNGVQSFSVPHGLTGLTWPAGSDSSTGGVCDMVINCGDNGTFGGRVTAGGNKDANGRGDFKYPVPAGYLSLCDKNGAV